MPKQTRSFLHNLGANNEKAWFDAHRDDYDRLYIGPAKALVEALGPKLAKIAPEIQAVPKVNGSIFRINRDVRFSKDKRPYKDHIDLWFWEGANRKQGSPGFFFRLQSDSLLLGAGLHGFPKELLGPYRDAVADEESGRALVTITKRLAKAGYPVEGQRYKKVPRGFDADHPRGDLLRHDALHAAITLSPVPAQAHSAALVQLCTDHFRKLLPLHRWLVALTGRA